MAASHGELQEQSLPIGAPSLIADGQASGVTGGRLDLSPRSPTSALPIPTRSMQTSVNRSRPGVRLSGTAMKPDVNDVNSDAFLVNRRPIENPEVFRIEPRAKLRLRIIDKSGASTNFTIDLGSLRGTLFAVDGRPITPITGNRFPIAIANRCDIRIETPGPGVCTNFAVREADSGRAAFVLASHGAAIPRYSASGPFTAPSA